MGWMSLFFPPDLFSDFSTLLCAQGAQYAWAVLFSDFQWVWQTEGTNSRSQEN